MTAPTNSKERADEAVDAWIPQFPDGSGWDVTDEKAPYFYGHIAPGESARLQRKRARTLYKIVCVITFASPTPHHKNTYFVKGSCLNKFMKHREELFEQIVSIEQVERLPSPHEKLR